MRRHRRDVSQTCPGEVNSANEYWVKTGSLLHTDFNGKDLSNGPENVRFYLLSGVEHTGSGAARRSRRAPASSFGTRPIPTPPFGRCSSRWIYGSRRGDAAQERGPRNGIGRRISIPVADGVGIVPQKALGFPDIPGVTYTGVITVRHLFDFGPRSTTES